MAPPLDATLSAAAAPQAGAGVDLSTGASASAQTPHHAPPIKPTPHRTPLTPDKKNLAKDILRALGRGPVNAVSDPASLNTAKPRAAVKDTVFRHYRPSLLTNVTTDGASTFPAAGPSVQSYIARPYAPVVPTSSIANSSMSESVPVVPSGNIAPALPTALESAYMPLPSDAFNSTIKAIEKAAYSRRSEPLIIAPSGMSKAVPPLSTAERPVVIPPSDAQGNNVHTTVASSKQPPKAGRTERTKPAYAMGKYYRSPKAGNSHAKAKPSVQANLPGSSRINPPQPPQPDPPASSPPVSPSARLFLPSSPSTSPRPISDDNDVSEQSVSTEGQNYWPKVNRAYVLVPRAPDYVKKWHARKRRKIAHREKTREVVEQAPSFSRADERDEGKYRVAKKAQCSH